MIDLDVAHRQANQQGLSDKSIGLQLGLTEEEVYGRREHVAKWTAPLFLASRREQLLKRAMPLLKDLVEFTDLDSFAIPKLPDSEGSADLLKTLERVHSTEYRQARRKHMELQAIRMRTVDAFFSRLNPYSVDSTGNTEPSEMLQALMGPEPPDEALLRRLGRSVADATRFKQRMEALDRQIQEVEHRVNALRGDFLNRQEQYRKALVLMGQADVSTLHTIAKQWLKRERGADCADPTEAEIEHLRNKIQKRRAPLLELLAAH